MRMCAVNSGSDTSGMLQQPVPTKKLLYVHQEKWQQRLLVKYGNAMSLLDATYKTTHY